MADSDEGKIAKGGRNLTYQITERPPDPPPMRPGTLDWRGREVPPDPAYTMPPPERTSATAPLPERAHREGDQPLPTAGKHDVLAELAATVPPALAARRAIGIRRYGRPLETWNGRDVHQDLDDELLDALAYSRQARLERRDLEAEVARLRAELDKARADLDSHVKALDARIADLRSDRDEWQRQAADNFRIAERRAVERDEAIRERDALRRVVD